MARIRTIKPEFFRHEELYELEQEHKLPLRLAFAGLWCVCDREGRFKWRPNQLKTEILPYDKCDFSRVLDALATRGFVEEYESDTGELYGFVPTFTVHQVINNRESKSQILSPFDACATRDPRALRVHKGKGKERKGMEKEGKGRERNTAIGYTDEFLNFWNLYPRKDGSKQEAFQIYIKAINKGVGHEIIERGVRGYANFVRAERTEQRHIAHATTWLNQGRWDSDYTIKQFAAPRGKGYEAATAAAKAIAMLDERDNTIELKANRHE
jgi:hypothetical protein